MKDCTGLVLTVSDHQALATYEEAIAALIRFADPTAALTRALEIEPRFPMALVLSGHLALWSTDRADLPAARTALAELDALPSGQLNSRERLHREALRVWSEGRLHQAALSLDRLLLTYPQDILALLSGHQLDFFVGAATNLRDRLLRALPAWSPEHPYYGYLLGMLSFGQEEAGQYERAEETAYRAVAANPGDIWGIHAVAHALEMQGKHEQGLAFLEKTRPQWTQDNLMVSHNAVHLGLFQLENGLVDDAVALYDSHIHWPGITPQPMVLVDGSSILWRLFLERQPLGERPQELADSWAKKADQQFYSFNDAHAMLAFAAQDDLSQAEDFLQRLSAQRPPPDSAYALMHQRVGLPVARAVLAFAREDYAQVIDELLPIKNSTGEFGGSHAQRDVFARTLLEAAIRAGDRPLAQALLVERQYARPQSLYNQQKQAQVASL